MALGPGVARLESTIAARRDPAIGLTLLPLSSVLVTANVASSRRDSSGSRPRERGGGVVSDRCGDEPPGEASIGGAGDAAAWAEHGRVRVLEGPGPAGRPVPWRPATSGP